ncbi:hypothetical protein AVEN_202623-1 [Araneus ventricosus]|uniref:Uncharacterized protein n=1 Tax=Araneus ventricosus TaxID=182803 RepID=A0A4Y2R1C8_ARAVE|nr:hypothetical protein AVEN_202623-1 [Araneus ventricosus]
MPQNAPHHNVTKTRPELLKIVKEHKEKCRAYELDQIAYEMGYEMDVRKLIDEALLNVTMDDWKTGEKQKLHEEDFAKLGTRDDVIERIVINLLDDSEISFSESEDEVF